MPAQARLTRPAVLALSCSALALGLTACKVDSRPLLARGEPAYAALPAPPDFPYGPDTLGLPYAQPARVMPVSSPYEGYALAERAYAYDRAAYQAPPDYGFRYREEDPWAWQLADDSLMFAEPYEDDYRFYYYEPGEDQPYFVRDQQYGYAYGDNGALTALFSVAGALLPNTQLSQLADVAGRYLARGQDLRQTYYGAPRYPVAERAWIDRAPLIYAAQEPWIAAADSQPIWRQYRESTGQRALMAFEPERVRREQIAARFSDRIDWGSPKEIRKAQREQAKEIRKVDKERVKSARKVEHAEARDARDFARPAAAVVRRDHDDYGRRAHGFKGEDRPFGPDVRDHGRDVEDRGGRDRGRREVARIDPAAAAAGRGDDHGHGDKDRGGGKHGGGRGGEAKDHGGGHGKGKGAKD